MPWRHELRQSLTGLPSVDHRPAEKSIDFRPREANDRNEYGHWEGDLIIGKDGKGAALLTFTESMTREKKSHVYKYIMHIHIDQENVEAMKMQITEKIKVTIVK